MLIKLLLFDKVYRRSFFFFWQNVLCITIYSRPIHKKGYIWLKFENSSKNQNIPFIMTITVEVADVGMPNLILI